MSEQKTKPHSGDVHAFLDTVEDPQKRADCYQVLKWMQEITDAPPTLWGPSMIGFGTYHYKYESGREGDFFLTGFAPRKQNLSLYIMAGFSRYEELLQRLGKFKTGKSCLYLKRLSDVDPTVLRELIQASVHYMKEKHP